MYREAGDGDGDGDGDGGLLVLDNENGRENAGGDEAGGAGETE
jgi:hypothetical protein